MNCAPDTVPLSPPSESAQTARPDQCRLRAKAGDGPRRTPDDKRRCVKIALAEFPDWSDRRIAEACAVDGSMVADVSKQLQESCSYERPTKRDALIYALGANTANGLRRTNDDKRRCVQIALKEFPDWSDRRIAEACLVSNPFVSKIHNELLTVNTSTPTTRIGKDGKQYPAKRESRGWTAPEVAQAKERQARR